MLLSVAGAIWWTALALTVAGCAYLLLAIASLALYRPGKAGRWTNPPSLTLLKPLCGLEDGLEEALASFLEQETTSAVHFVFGVSDAGDPALALARTVAARYPSLAVSFVADPTVHGPNPKVSNLINMAAGSAAAAGSSEIVALSDSDIFITPGSLQRAIDALAVPGTGAVTALYRGRPGMRDNTVRNFAAWFLDYWFLPMAVLHARLAPLSVTYGPLTLVRREVLNACGGLAALVDHLSDDAELGKRVHQAGHSVAFTPDIAETLVNDAGMPELFDHELRWARTVRGLDPLGYAASLVSHPGPLPLLLLIWPGWIAAAGITLPILLRWLLAALVQRRFGRADGLPRPGLLGLWLRDCGCFAIWLAGCMVSKVGWRGARLAVERRDILRSRGA